MLAASTRALSITISFEEALKLNIAVAECVRKLNSYNRAVAAGKRTALQMVIHFNKGRVRILEGKL